MATQSKFLVLNPSPNNIESIIKKANLQNSKNGPFEAVFLLGDSFPKGSSIPNNDIDAPTYFSEGRNGLLDTVVSEEGTSLVNLKDNLKCLRSGLNLISTSSGFTVATLSGHSHDEAEKEQIINELTNLKKKIDILLSFEWPYAIAKQEELSLVGDKFIDQVVKICQPKYHFAVGNDNGKYFENNIFKWDNGDFTRFISLGQEGGGEKWFYAFGLSSEPTTTPESNLGNNPFIEIKKDEISQKRPLEKAEEKVIKRPKVVSPENCFFCLSNPKVETHMIVSIGSHSYLTIAKGPLTRASKDLPFSGHAIIIPIEHIPTIRKLTSDIRESPIQKEIEQFKNSLVKAFCTNKPFYKIVFFEINRLSNIHQHVQMVPVPENLVERFESDLEEKAKINNENFKHNHTLNFRKFTDENDPILVDILNKSDYIMFTAYKNEIEKTIYISELDDPSKSLDLQFPRRVLSYTLKCPKRTYWEKCQQPKHREARECEEFKAFYKESDFTINK